MLQRPDGQMTEGTTEMEAFTTAFYTELYTSNGVKNIHHVLDAVPFKVTVEVNEQLIAPYSQKEVKEALF